MTKALLNSSSEFPVQPIDANNQRLREANEGYERIYTIKKIALSTFKLLNVAGILGLLVVTVMYVPIPLDPITDIVIAFPFIVGIIGGLADEGVSAGPFTEKNVKGWLTPATVIARYVTRFFFAPYKWIENRVDLTPYHDKDARLTIEKRLGEGSFTEVVKYHGKHLDNLCKHGYIHLKQLPLMKELYAKYKPNQEQLERFKAKHASVLPKEGEETDSFMANHHRIQPAEERNDKRLYPVDIEFLQLEGLRRAYECDWKMNIQPSIRRGVPGFPTSLHREEIL